MAKLLKMLWEYMDLTVLPFFETWSAHIFGGWQRVCWCTNEAFNQASPTKEFWENCPQKKGGHIYGKNEGWAYLRKLQYQFLVKRCLSEGCPISIGVPADKCLAMPIPPFPKSASCYLSVRTSYLRWLISYWGGVRNGFWSGLGATTRFGERSQTWVSKKARVTRLCHLLSLQRQSICHTVAHTAPPQSQIR